LRRRVSLLAIPVVDFFPEYANLGRRVDGQTDGLAVDLYDSDRQPALRHQNPFTDLATENEHD
jgi:hypothetical protein